MIDTEEAANPEGIADPSYHVFTANRVGMPDFKAFTTQIRALDPTAGCSLFEGSTVRVKKATPWSPQQLASAQSLLDTLPITDPVAADANDDKLVAAVTALWECIPNPLMTQVALRARIIALLRAARA